MAELSKRGLAREIVAQLYDQKQAAEAEKHFEKVVQKKEAPEKIQEVITKELLERIRVRLMTEKGTAASIKEVGKPETTREWLVPIPLLLTEIGLAKSRSDARRLIKQESVRIDNKTVYENYEEHGYTIKIGSVINVGRRWVKLVSPD
jgi:tyrosyl-tRNA synthetase